MPASLVNGDGGVHHDRPHVAHLLQVGVDVDRVEDAEPFLANLVAAPRGPADHLVIENAAVDPADEDEVADRGHVDPRRQQVDGDDIIGIGIILEPLDRVERPVDRAGDLLDQVVRQVVVFRLQRGAQFDGQPRKALVGRTQEFEVGGLPPMTDNIQGRLRTSTTLLSSSD